MKKIVFMGSDPITLPLLEFLKNEGREAFALQGVISQPDRPAGRGHKLQPSAVSEWALNTGIPLLRPEKLTLAEYNWLKSHDIDLVFVMAYGHLIRKDFLDLPPLGMFNFHASLLPKYRGASPIETAIACGETFTGVTLMKMVVKMDAGPILDQEIVRIETFDTRFIVRQKIVEACIPLLKRNIGSLLKGSPKLTEQDASLASYTRKIHKEDGRINFQLPAKEIADRHRAFEAWPGTFFDYQGTVLKVGELSWSEVAGSTHLVGQIVEVNPQTVTIQTVSGLLHIHQLQRPGGRMLNVSEFLKGFSLETGVILESQVGEPLVHSAAF